MKPLYCGNFRELQSRFIFEVSEQRKGNPFAPLYVLVPGRLAGLALSRALAREGCSHSHVHFVTLGDFAAEAAAPLLRKRQLRLLPEMLRGAVMGRVVDSCGDWQYYSRQTARAPFRSALWRTLSELRSAGLKATDVQKILPRISGPESDTLRRKLTDLCTAWQTLEILMREHGYADAATVLTLACEAEAAAANATPIIFYALFELNGLERRLVEALSHRAMSAYLLYRETPACAWVKPLYSMFMAQGFVPRHLEYENAMEASLLSRVGRGLFEEVTPTERPIDESDNSLLIISAPSRERESEELVREVLYSPLGEREPRRRIGVLLRERDPYANLLRHDFASAGISAFMHEGGTLGQTGAGRALRLLAGLLDGKLRRADAMEFLLCAPVKWPQELPDGSDVIPVSEWNQFSIEAGIVGGRTVWIDGLRRLQHQLTVEREERSVEDDEGDNFRASRLRSLDAMQRYAVYVGRRLRNIDAARTWQAKSALLWALFLELVETTDSEQAALQADFHTAHDLDLLGTSADRENFAAWVNGLLSLPAPRETHFQIHEPSVAIVPRAMGVLFDEVLLPGLVEREVPRPVSQDPLLLDEERELVQHALGTAHTVPMRSREREREAFLFYAAVGSATQRLVLSYPRTEIKDAREKLPSAYLLRVAEAATGKSVDYEALAEFITDSPQGCRLPMSRLRLTDASCTATALHYDEARIGEALAASDSRPLLYLLHDAPFFARGVQAESERFGPGEFAIYDGVMRDAELKKRFAVWQQVRMAALTPSQMEVYLTCPFRFFTTRILDVQQVDEPVEIRDLRNWERGHLAHGILADFYRAERDAGRLPLQRGAPERLQVAAEKQFQRFECENITGLYLLWKIGRRRILRWLLAFVQTELEEGSAFVPTRFEQPFTVAEGDGNAMSFRGRIDRLDLAPDGRARVIDYRTGSDRDFALKGVSAVRLAMFRLAAEHLLNSEVESAAYYYLADGVKHRKAEFSRSDWEERRNEFMDLATVVREGVSEGRFFPYGEEKKCSRCPARTACGTGRLSPKSARDLDQTRPLRDAVEGKK